MTLINYTYNPQPGDPEDISQIMANFNAIKAIVNGQLDNSNIANAANIALAKLGQGGAAVGQAVVWNGSAWAPGAPGAGGGGLTRGTVFPGAPTDLQQFALLVDSTNGVVWNFLYRSASGSTYKWEFIGGPPLVVSVSSAGNIPGTSYGDASDAAVSITVPVGGDYNVESSVGTINASGATISSSPTNASVAPKIGAAAVNDNDSFGGEVDNATDAFTNGHRLTFHTGVAAAAAIKQQYKLNAALSSGSVTVSRRTLAVWPRRCG